MQLVETGVHSQTGHTGGFSLWNIKNSNRNNSLWPLFIKQNQS
ncbi:MAG: WHH domain containing protein [Flavobacteriaceae bacterium FS1-H7996/R]|nr:MAG: WHH domain containing protein [Flavobacteriaceae bacterium FS1-H7996/R]